MCLCLLVLDGALLVNISTHRKWHFHGGTLEKSGIPVVWMADGDSSRSSCEAGEDGTG